MRYSSLIVASFTLLLACDSGGPSGPAARPSLGIIEWVAESSSLSAYSAEADLMGREWSVIAAPEEVLAGETFDVVVTTLGPTRCWSVDRTEVQLASREAEIIPYDRTASDGLTIMCPDAEVLLAHHAQLRFDEPGEARIIVRGRRVIGPDKVESNDVFFLEARLVVRAP